MIKVLLAFLVSSVATPAVLMLDFNNGDKETAACASADPGNVYAVNEKTMGVNYVDAEVVERAITGMEASDICIDTLTISGHHGVGGEFFGGDDEDNGITAKELKAILARHPKTANCLRNVALAGCYTGTVDAGNSHWLRVGPNVNFTIGFPLQAPDKNAASGHKLFKQFCSREKREAAANAGTKDALCEFYKNMPLLAKMGVSVSNCYNIATNLYGPKTCSTFQELENRCSEFDPDSRLKQLWESYYNAEPGFEDPPLDGADVEAEPGKTDMRLYYDQLHLWRHCKDKLQADRDYDMPPPAQVIRMVKFKQIKDNLNRLNRKELAEYDARLREAGLGQYALGDLSRKSMTRGAIRRKVFDAMKAINKMGHVQVGSTDTRALWRMAYGMNLTFVELRSSAQRPDGSKASCSYFELVHANSQNPNNKSKCIVGYDEAAKEMGVQ